MLPITIAFYLQFIEVNMRVHLEAIEKLKIKSYHLHAISKIKFLTVP